QSNKPETPVSGAYGPLLAPHTNGKIVNSWSQRNTIVNPNAKRNVLVGMAAAGIFGLFLFAAPGHAQKVSAAANLRAPGEDNAIRPFHVKVPEKTLVDLRRRIVATKWPERETVSDA